MTYRFIEHHRGQYPVIRMCQVLGVSSSGYYAWRNRKPSQRARENQRLRVHIRAIHKQSKGTYGSPRIHAELRAQGIQCSRGRVARLMKLEGLKGHRRTRFKATTQSNHRLPIAPNLLARRFVAQQPNEKWLADITYIDTRRGWLYLAAIMDVFSRRIGGWSMSKRIQSTLVEDALLMALRQRQPGDRLLHHSDQGIQYAGTQYQALLETHGMVCSMSRVSDPYDNAMMESFFASLKSEWAPSRYEDRVQARRSLFEYIEIWYNRQRRHSALGYLSPVQFEALHA
jgi:putative transposase